MTYNDDHRLEWAILGFTFLLVIVVCVGFVIHTIWFAEPATCYEVQIDGVRYECVP